MIRNNSEGQQGGNFNGPKTSARGGEQLIGLDNISLEMKAASSGPRETGPLCLLDKGKKIMVDEQDYPQASGLKVWTQEESISDSGATSKVVDSLQGLVEKQPMNQNQCTNLSCSEGKEKESNPKGVMTKGNLKKHVQKAKKKKGRKEEYH